MCVCNIAPKIPTEYQLTLVQNSINLSLLVYACLYLHISKSCDLKHNSSVQLHWRKHIHCLPGAYLDAAYRLHQVSTRWIQSLWSVTRVHNLVAFATFAPN